MKTTIHTLPALSGTAAMPSLKEQIESGLKGTSEVTVPGDREEDKLWAYKRSVPTVVLYDEQGLRLYDKITSDAPEYYLFEDELNLFKHHGDEIARSMGFGKKIEKERRYDYESTPDRRWKPARWGDAALGKWNHGVNGEEGLGGGPQRGYDVVELGAGALRKTGYLLSALADATPTTTCGKPPIRYHALDLSYPELERVLGEMDEAFGENLNGKIECVGLHGDYDSGLQTIREGKLSTLLTQSNGMYGRSKRHDSVSTAASEEIVTPSTPFQVMEPLIEHIEPCDDMPEPLLKKQGPLSAFDVGSPGTGDFDRFNHATPGSESDIEETSPSPPLSRPSPAPERENRPLHLVFLGSSLGNFSREGARSFLKSLPLRPGDTLLLGLDGRPAPGKAGCLKVETAYNDPAGHTRAFEEHGWDIVRQELGLEGDAGVDFVGRYNEVLGRHEAYFKSKERQKVRLPVSEQEVVLDRGELLQIEWSYKYSTTEALDLFQHAGLRTINSWKAPESEYRLWLLERPDVKFDMTIEMPVAQKPSDLDSIKGVPKMSEWQDLWKLWDHITLDMIPEKMLHQKPIDLRHICLFYLGHIPTFLDIHLTRMLKGRHSEPEYFKDIFERGIDPDVDDPSQIHVSSGDGDRSEDQSHSEVPTAEADWPALGEILTFRDNVRARLRSVYDQAAAGQLALSRRVGRILFMTFEHEAMHAETLLYMLAQSPTTRPPTAVAKPDFDALAKRWDSEATPNRILSIPGGSVELGHLDLEREDYAFPTSKGWESHEYGWDNEHPRISVQVKPFKVDSLPITNEAYLEFLRKTGADFDDIEAMPASWQKVEGEWKVRSLYGPLDFGIAGKWPLMASKMEIDRFAQHKKGRLPTESELRLLWESSEGPRPDSQLANIGFRNWHPIPPMNTCIDNAGHVLRGHNGGVWEWTSSVFEGLEGYVPSDLYPGYSADFFDRKHNVVLGGSYATVPQIAGRRSFRNWYQTNYRFSFIGGRVAYDE